jgi:hypothetical protein
MLIYPNPVLSTVLTVEIQAVDDPTLQLYDILGNRIMVNFVKELGSGYILDVGNLKPGVYMVKMVDGQTNIVQRLVIE